MNSRVPVSGLLPEELVTMLSLDKRFRGEQIFSGIHSGLRSFNSFTNLSKQLREDLERDFCIFSSSIDSIHTDKTTSKLRIKLSDGLFIEAVLMKDNKNRQTACISSQVGCAMGCVFCKTGTMGLLRNLNAAEIVEQIWHLYDNFGLLDNVVYMGMGEPLNNLEEVRKSINVLTHPKGLGMSTRRITLSTCGLVKGIRDITENGPPVRLAVSLTTGDEELRSRLMPVTKSNSLHDLQQSLVAYQKKYNKRITMEAVILGGIDHRKSDIDAIARFIKPLKAVVNVIPWNPIEELDFVEPSQTQVESFLKGLEKRGINVTRRYERGKGVNAACGQLGGK